LREKEVGRRQPKRLPRRPKKAVFAAFARAPLSSEAATWAPLVVDTADRHFAAACPFPLRESTADVGDEAQRSHAEGRGGVYREAASRREGTRIPDLVKGTGVGG